MNPINIRKARRAAMAANAAQEPKDPNAVALGRKGGASRSPAKQAASRANGRKRKASKITFREGERVWVHTPEYLGPHRYGTVTILLPTLLGVTLDDGSKVTVCNAPAEAQP